MFIKPHFTEISSTSNIKVELGGIVNMVKEKNTQSTLNVSYSQTNTKAVITL